MIKAIVPFVQTHPDEPAKQVPAWMSALCGGVVGAVESKLGKIIQGQIKKAESGDTSATQFVLELYAQSQAVLSNAAILATTADPPLDGDFLGDDEFSLLCALNDAGGPVSVTVITAAVGDKKKATDAAHTLIRRGFVRKADAKFEIMQPGINHLNRTK